MPYLAKYITCNPIPASKTHPELSMPAMYPIPPSVTNMAAGVLANIRAVMFCIIFSSTHQRPFPEITSFKYYRVYLIFGNHLGSA